VPKNKDGIHAGALLGRALIFGGLILLTFLLGSGTLGILQSRFALRQFVASQAAASQNDTSHTVVQWSSDAEVDFSLWAPKRIQAYKESLLLKKDIPLAVLHIDKLTLNVLVFEGTDDLTLNRGVGRITGTALPGESGNIGIAGHRDGFFRGLKDIAVGDAVELTTPKQKATYTVDQIEIVTPADVHVLQPRGAPSLTMVTCYPFYFVGDAPKRFIVHASISSMQSNSSSAVKDESQ
jgi:sortase A